MKINMRAVRHRLPSNARPLGMCWFTRQIRSTRLAFTRHSKSGTGVCVCVRVDLWDRQQKIKGRSNNLKMYLIPSLWFRPVLLFYAEPVYSLFKTGFTGKTVRRNMGSKMRKKKPHQTLRKKIRTETEKEKEGEGSQKTRKASCSAIPNNLHVKVFFYCTLKKRWQPANCQ